MQMATDQWGHIVVAGPSGSPQRTSRNSEAIESEDVLTISHCS